MNENDTNQIWNVLVRFDEFWQCFTQARTSGQITKISGLLTSKLGRKGWVTVLPDWPNDERGPLYALAVIEETIRTYGRRNVSSLSSVMLITNRLHCTMNSTKCFTHEIYEDKNGRINATNLFLLFSNDVEGRHPFGGSIWVWGEKNLVSSDRWWWNQDPTKPILEHMFYLIRETTPLSTEHQIAQLIERAKSKPLDESAPAK